MTGTIIIQVSKEDLKEALKESLIEFESEHKSKEIKLLTVNQVARRLNKAHATIKKLIRQNYIKTTADGLITEQAINDYLNNV